MSSTPFNFTKFAVAGGAGNLGAFVTSALLKQGASVVVLSRKPADVPAGATLHIVDYTNESTLERVLRETETEVLVSTLSGPGIDLQPSLAVAAKKGGVKHFVPSEFGMRTDEIEGGVETFVGKKVGLHRQLRELELPYTLYYTGLFSDWFCIPLFGFDHLSNNKVTIIGSGTTPCTWTARVDIAHFLAYTLTHLPLAQLTNSTLHLQGERLSYLQAAEILAELFNGGKPYDIVHTSLADAEFKVQSEGATAFVEYIGVGAEKGWLDMGRVDNELVPDWTPQSFRQGVRNTSA